MHRIVCNYNCRTYVERFGCLTRTWTRTRTMKVEFCKTYFGNKIYISNEKCTSMSLNIDGYIVGICNIIIKNNTNLYVQELVTSATVSIFINNPIYYSIIQKYFNDFSLSYIFQWFDWGSVAVCMRNKLKKKFNFLSSPIRVENHVTLSLRYAFWLILKFYITIEKLSITIFMFWKEWMLIRYIIAVFRFSIEPRFLRSNKKTDQNLLVTDWIVNKGLPQSDLLLGNKNYTISERLCFPI